MKTKNGKEGKKNERAMFLKPRWINFGTMREMFHENNWVEGKHKLS